MFDPAVHLNQQQRDAGICPMHQCCQVLAKAAQQSLNTSTAKFRVKVPTITG